MRQYFLYFILLFSIQAYCIEKDTLSHFLDDIVITSKKTSSPLRSSDTRVTKMDMEFMHNLPKIFGNADPLHYTQMLPGIQTNAEYDAGLHIQGCENSHNLISIEGVPVYNASHLLGFFSTFIPSHFSTMSITKNATSSEGYNRIGGIMDMELYDKIPEKRNGEFSVGLMSSQGTYRTPIGKNAALFTSLRFSYLNMIYSPLLKIDDGQLKYTFGDINITYLQKIGKRHTLDINLYSGIDKANLENTNNTVFFENHTSWGNLLGSIHWDYKLNEGNLKQTIYFSGYRNRLNIVGDYNIGLPSGIYDIGYRSTVSLQNIKAGISVIGHNIKPQTPVYDNLNIITDNNPNEQHAIESNIFASYEDIFLNRFHYHIALKGNLYNNLKGYSHIALDPYAMLAYETSKVGRIEFSYSIQHQYMLNCGFTSLGMPIEFWIGADSYNKPQYSHSCQFIYKRELFNGKYEASIETYYKRLYNQIEHIGSPFDIINKRYSLDDMLIHGHGHNYGASIMLNKLTGKLTGWASYSFGRALRKYDIYGDKWFPANHERIHEVNLVASYKIGKRFDIGGTFAYASGTPFTAVKYLYLINNNILTEFGEHNANRLKDYIRLDVSANYDFIKRNNRSAGINLSIYNVLCRKNEIYYGLKPSKNGFRFRSVAFLTNILPSVSLYYKF